MTRSPGRGLAVSLDLDLVFFSDPLPFNAACAVHDSLHPSDASVQVIVLVVPAALGSDLDKQASFIHLVTSHSRCLAAASPCRIRALTRVLACALVGKAKGAATSSSIRVPFANAKTNRRSAES